MSAGAKPAEYGSILSSWRSYTSRTLAAVVSARSAVNLDRDELDHGRGLGAIPSRGDARARMALIGSVRADSVRATFGFALSLRSGNRKPLERQRALKTDPSWAERIAHVRLADRRKLLRLRRRRMGIVVLLPTAPDSSATSPSAWAELDRGLARDARSTMPEKTMKRSTHGASYATISSPTLNATSLHRRQS